MTLYTYPPVSTDLIIRDWPQDSNLIAICGNLTVI
jgi:hypothetical protein